MGYAQALSGAAAHHGQNRVMVQPNQEPNKPIQHMNYQPRPTTQNVPQNRPQYSQQGRQHPRQQSSPHVATQAQLQQVLISPYQTHMYPGQPLMWFRGPSIPQYFNPAPQTAYIPRAPTNHIYPGVDLSASTGIISSAPIVPPPPTTTQKKDRSRAIPICDPNTGEEVDLNMDKEETVCIFFLSIEFLFNFYIF